MFLKYPSIEAFRKIEKFIVGEKEFVGTVKLHGTNAAVGFDSEGKIFTQSRNKIITEDDDNLGFAKFARNNFKDGDFKDLIIYGEYCGNKIQKGVAVSNLKERSFFVFGMKKISNCEKVPLEGWTFTSDLVYNIMDFETYKLTYTPETRDEFIAKVEEITERIDKQCPVGEQLGLVGAGEGVVWSTKTGLKFKHKGEKHKIKKVNKITYEPVNLDCVLTEARIDQTKSENVGKLPYQKCIWLYDDLVKEEPEIMEKITKKYFVRTYKGLFIDVQEEEN